VSRFWSRLWSRLRVPLREALLPFAVARVIVLGALGLAHFIVDRTHPSTPGVAARVHSGLLGWDAGWYEGIARSGYAHLGHQSLRFFPLVPLVTHVLAYLPGLNDGAALVVLSNVAALVATMLFFVLVRRETADPVVARRAIWFLSLAPSAFLLVMGYAESVLLCLVLGCFLALRPGLGARPNFGIAAVLAFAAALTRPIGILVAAAVAVELVRWWARMEMGERRAGLAAFLAPFVGLAAFLAWSAHVAGSWLTPLRVQLENSHHGGLSDPLATLFDDARGLVHHHVGTALHVPWLLVALILLVVCWRHLPATYTVFAAAVLAVAVSGSNLDSFERYALSAFPLTMAAALVVRGPRVERAALVLLSAALAGYTLLAFLNIFVP
jgi:hypothetical protein